jgi:hypothetical protein
MINGRKDGTSMHFASLKESDNSIFIFPLSERNKPEARQIFNRMKKTEAQRVTNVGRKD